MKDPDYGAWQPIETAPRDGTRVLVALRASEQGPAEVDVARWVAERTGDAHWIAADSDPTCVIIYSDADLASWMPLPTPLPPLRSAPAKAADTYESDGSAI